MVTNDGNLIDLHGILNKEIKKKKKQNPYQGLPINLIRCFGLLSLAPINRPRKYESFGWL